VVTSGVLTDTAHEPDPDIIAGGRPDDADPSPDAASSGVPDIVRRRLARPIGSDLGSWVATGVIVLIAGVLRLYNLRWPPGKIFDELYYATEGHSLLKHGVEWDDNGGKYVVHPPLGKWCIALGEKIFGYNEFGWRISAAVAGIACVLILTRIARRLFRSTILGCTAGLLLALDGMQFVLSRTALLDIFLVFFILAAFACLVMDREQRRARWLAALDAGLDPTDPHAGRKAKLGVPWWRLGAAVMLGCAGGVKWSAIYYVLAFILLTMFWEITTRRSAGVPNPISQAALPAIGWAAAMMGIVLTVYLLSWSGWFLTDSGYFRHWLRDSGKPEGTFGALQNLWHYHVEAWKFHTGLSSKHQYQSWPWQWLLLGRPVAFYWSGDGPCGASSCAAEVLLLGTPLLWWSFLPAIIGMAWLGIARRDWRVLAIGVAVAMGILPWFWNELDNRTMFYFYAAPAGPFLVLAVVYVLGAIIGPPPGTPGVSADRRLYGALIAGAYIALVAACFGYFYPIYSGQHLPYASWFARMWLGNRWI
jgi:dolichyl-phosphate-mannose--protein O-mannosyl transferase